MIDKKKLSALYKSSDIQVVWQESQNLAVIFHPELGKISPNQYRAKFRNKPCPICGGKMRQGDLYKTNSKQEAINRGYEYINLQRESHINRAGKTYFHPNYISLDHKFNKARFPEKMFDADNLVAICWRCNIEKSDNNHFEIQQDFEYIEDLSRATIAKYPKL